jgi:hypothetical protein
MAESCAITLTKVDTSGTDPAGTRCLTFTWQAAADGSLSAYPISANQAKVLSGLYAVQAVINPGATAPTASYDVTLTDTDGVDVFGGTLGNLSATASAIVRPDIATLAGKRLVQGVLTFNLTNNSVNSANGVIKVYFTSK